MSLIEKLGFNGWSDLGQFLWDECLEELDGTELHKRLGQLDLGRTEWLPGIGRYLAGAAPWLLLAAVLGMVIGAAAVAIFVRYRLARRAQPGDITWGLDGYTLHVRGARKRTGRHNPRNPSGRHPGFRSRRTRFFPGITAVVA